MVAITLLLSSCSKDDDKNTSIEATGGEIFKSQIVTVSLDIELSEEEYIGTLGNTEVVLRKSEDGKLLFIVPSTSMIGLHDLVIPNLNNAVIHYEVKEPELMGTPEAVLEDFNANLGTFSTELDGSPHAITAQNAINSFNNVFENATEEEKKQIAILYQTNKEMIDNIILNDFSDVTGRVTASDMLIVVKRKLAIIAMVGGAMITLYCPSPVEKALGIAIIAVGAYKSQVYFIQLKERVLNVIQVLIDDVRGEFQRNPNETFNLSVKLIDDVAKSVTFKVAERKLVSGDASKTESGAVSFFADHFKYNNCISNVNEKIAFVNNTLPFANFGLIALETLPSSAPETIATADENVFGKIVFSLNHPNLALVSSTYSNGQMSLKVKITGEPASLPVIAALKFSYKDEFSSFSGTLPIEVDRLDSSEVLIGTQTWMTTNLNVSNYRNGDPIPQIQDSEAFSNATTGAWCYYENNTANGAIYGKLYNKYAVLDPRGLAPVGWHVPNDAEWDLLIATIDPNPVPDDYAGVSQVAGGKMKATGTTLWQAPNEGATNITRFKAIPSGYKSPNGSFRNLGQEAKYWSRTAIGNTFSNQYSVTYNTPKVFKIDIANHGGLAVRCIKD